LAASFAMQIIYHIIISYNSYCLLSKSTKISCESLPLSRLYNTLSKLPITDVETASNAGPSYDHNTVTNTSTGSRSKSQRPPKNRLAAPLSAATGL